MDDVAASLRHDQAPNRWVVLPAAKSAVHRLAMLVFITRLIFDARSAVATMEEVIATAELANAA